MKVVTFAYFGAAAGYVVGAVVMMAAMSVDTSNAGWSGPLLGGLVFAGGLVGAAVGSLTEDPRP